MRRVAFAAVCLLAGATVARAADELVDQVRYAGGEPVPFVLTTAGDRPSHAVILMPGGPGNLSPQMSEGRLVMKWGGNFLIRSRELFAGPRVVAVSADATTTPARVLAIVGELRRRYGDISVYAAGNSRATISTMQLGERMDGQLAGFIHTSSLNAVASYDTRGFRSRHLLVHHRMDTCTGSTFASAEYSHKRYGTPLFAMEGGISIGASCDAYAHHGFNGIEKETVDRIVTWMLSGG